LEIAKWVVLQIRNHLEDILLVARSGTTDFGLSYDNTLEINKRNFQASTFMSAYLHRLHVVNDILVSHNFLFKIIADIFRITENPIGLHESSPPLCHSERILCFEDIDRTQYTSSTFEVPFVET
jgi:hypothetical protein